MRRFLENSNLRRLFGMLSLSIASVGCAPTIDTKNFDEDEREELIAAPKLYSYNKDELNEAQQSALGSFPVTIIRTLQPYNTSLGNTERLAQLHKSFSQELCEVTDDNNPFDEKVTMPYFPVTESEGVGQKVFKTGMEAFFQAQNSYYRQQYAVTARVVANEFGLLCRSAGGWQLVEDDRSVAKVVPPGRLVISTGLLKGVVNAALAWGSLGADQLSIVLMRVQNPKDELDLRAIMLFSEYRRAANRLDLVDEQTRNGIIAISRISAIMRMILLHETAHLRLNHLELVEVSSGGVQKCNTIRNAEMAADADALRAFIAVQNSPMYSFGTDESKRRRELTEMLLAYEQIGDLHSGSTSESGCNYPSPLERRAALMAQIRAQ